jgi:hypothetical protein
MNVVMNDGGGFIELQGTAEGHAFRRDELDALLGLAEGRGRTAGRTAGGAVGMNRRIALTTLVVADYDEAIAWYTGKLGFAAGRHRPGPQALGGGRPDRRQRRRPAAGPRQRRGTAQPHRQPDRWPRRLLPQHRRLPPRPRGDAGRRRRVPGSAARRTYATVAVFRDLYGNTWDLLEPRQ